MIHLEKSVVNTLQKAIFKDKTFCDLFTDYQPELFERTKDEQVFYVNQRYSEYESNKLVSMFERYKSFKPFKTKNYEKAKGLARVTDMGGFEILIGKSKVGYCGYDNIKNSGYTLNFMEVDLNDERKWNWITFRVRFRNTDEAKEWLKKPSNYLKLQMKYDLRLEDE